MVVSTRKLQTLPQLLGAASLIALSGQAVAGAKIAVDDTHWVSVGAGIKTSFSTVEDGANSGKDWSKDFAVENMRLYVSGQVHKYVKLVFNTEISNWCSDCGADGDLFVLDAMAQLEFMPEFNIWMGRMLTPADRIEMNGPFYSLNWNQYTVPLFPSDQLNNDAGKYGRDNGVTFWGTVGHFQYAVGAFDGYNGASNDKDSLLYAARLAYNFLNLEQNPGYYTSGTYYGGLGNVFTVGFVVQHQTDGAGTAFEAADFTGYVVDVLWEQVLGEHVMTIDGEYKVFDTDLSSAARMAAGDCFCLFDGDSWFGTFAWLFPAEVGIGKFQPYVRYTSTSPDDYADDSDLLELGLNYVIRSHNAKVTLSYTNGDANLTGEPGEAGSPFQDGSAILLGAQVQI